MTSQKSLFLVPVPIGNLGDITFRAVEVLKSVDFIIAEDTRYSIKLLNHLQIKKKMVSYFKPRENEKAQQIIDSFETPHINSAALITDSGTPAISDPGFILVKKAIEKNIQIVSLPGPTAFVPALVSSGIDTRQFVFLGFSPRKKNELSQYLKKIASLEFTLIFYESPHRVLEFFEIAPQILGDRPFALIKELTKLNEKIIRGSLGNALQLLKNEILLGEMVIIIQGSSPASLEAQATPLKLDSLDDLFQYFKETHQISKNQLKKIIMNR